jgi:hypothetical protein
MPSTGLETAIPEIKRLQTYTLGHTVSGIGQKSSSSASSSSSSSSSARQPLVRLGFLKKLCPFVCVEGGILAVYDPWRFHILIHDVVVVAVPSQFRSSNTYCSFQFCVKYIFKGSITVHKHHVPANANLFILT